MFYWDSSSKTFSGTKFFRYRFRDFFPVPNFSDTGSDTLLRYQIFPIPVPRLFSGTNFFRYRFRYHQKNEKFPIPGIPGTGTSNSVYNTQIYKLMDGGMGWLSVGLAICRAPYSANNRLQILSLYLQSNITKYSFSLVLGDQHNSG